MNRSTGQERRRRHVEAVSYGLNTHDWDMYTGNDGLDLVEAVESAINTALDRWKLINRPKMIESVSLRSDKEGRFQYEPADGTMVQASDGSIWYYTEEDGWNSMDFNGSCSLDGPARVIHEPAKER